MKITAIVPALNEQETVGNVLKTLVGSKKFDEIILFDDGSSDETSKIGILAGARVIKNPKPGGKGNAMKKAVEATDAEIIVFFDADLLTLSESHISSLLEPILNRKAKMCVGLRGRWGGLPKIISKIDPLLAIGGERAMFREIFEAIPENFIQGFAVETALNYYCLTNKIKVAYADLKGLKVVVKEKKWGFWKGFKNRLKMIGQMIKIRFLILANRKKFIQVKK